MQINNYMDKAINLARSAYESNEVPVGCVIVKDGKFIAETHNLVETKKDISYHAELVAIKRASAFLNSKFLYDCEVYVTLEPCTMCIGALILSRVKRLYFGAYDNKTGACGSVFNPAESSSLNHKIEIFGGIKEKDCAHLLSEYFEKLRKKSK